MYNYAWGQEGWDVITKHSPEPQLLKRSIPFLHDSNEIQQIHKGYSTDTKYVVRKESDKYILRTFELKQLPQKKLEFDILQKMKEKQVLCSRPIEIGEIDAAAAGYMIVSYIEGNDASDELPRLSADEQFITGLEAGLELFKMHQYNAPDQIASWYDRQTMKHKRYMEQYAACGTKIEHDQNIIVFIEDNLKWMRNRPNTFQHDDFHVGNLIVMDAHLSGIIDFNRHSWGDPIFEFLKVGFFSSEISIPFSIGQIKGYFNNGEPEPLFWKLYSLYVAMSIFSSVVWIQKVKPEETAQMLQKINRVIEDHHCFEQTKPAWYPAG